MNNQKSGVVLALMIVLTVIGTGSVRGQEKREITPEWIFSDEAENITAVPFFKWLDDGKLLLYDKRDEQSRRRFDLLDPKSGERKPILDTRQALTSIRTMAKDMDTLSVLPWPDACDGVAAYGAYLFDDDIFLLNFSTSGFHRITQTKSAEKCLRFSPNGQYLSFVRDNDLYVYDIQAESERRLTLSGSDTLLNGT
jgi:dipeptidyl-peptidase 4